MKLSDYEILNEQVFYRGWHILEYINSHDLTELDIEAIKATIMDALVSNNDIDPMIEFLDFENLCITKDKTDNTYSYEKYPNISGIPLWIKEKFRKKSCKASAGIPISIYLTIVSKNRCLYDMNIASTAVFDDWISYIADYNSPTKIGKRVTSRAFIEIYIDEIPYLIDNLTRRIIRRDFLEKNYRFYIKGFYPKKMLNSVRLECYLNSIQDYVELGPYMSFYFSFSESFRSRGDFAEVEFEIEKSKEYFKDAWEKFIIEEEIMKRDIAYQKKKEIF